MLQCGIDAIDVISRNWASGPRGVGNGRFSDVRVPYTSRFSSARSSGPAATRPITGTRTVSEVSASIPSARRPRLVITIAREVCPVRVTKPFFSSALRWSWVAFGEAISSSAPISRMLGAYPCSRELRWMQRNTASWRSVMSSIGGQARSLSPQRSSSSKRPYTSMARWFRTTLAVGYRFPELVRPSWVLKGWA